MASVKLSHLCKWVFSSLRRLPIRLRLLFFFLLSRYWACTGLDSRFLHNFTTHSPCLAGSILQSSYLKHSKWVLKTARWARGWEKGEEVVVKVGSWGKEREGPKEDPHWGLIIYREVRRRNRFRLVYKEDQLSNGFPQSFDGEQPKLNLPAYVPQDFFFPALARNRLSVISSIYFLFSSAELTVICVKKTTFQR